MKTSIVPLVTVTVLAAASHCLAEHPIAKSDLPAAVLKTAERQSAGSTVLGYARDLENGKTEYEVQMMVDGHTKDVTIDSQGNLLEIEEQVQPESLSSPVLRGLAARATKGKITKIESLTKQGKLVAYEAQVESGKHHSEIQVGPDGGKLDYEE